MLGMMLDRNSKIPLSRQISSHIRALILNSHLRAGETLPSTRQLAEALCVSRNTVTDAYETLWAEGYICVRQGSRYTVESSIQLDTPFSSAQTATRIPIKPCRRIKFDFRTGLPDLSHFPFAKWNALQKHVLETRKPSDLLYSDPRGNPQLRNAIAAWLLRSRGIPAHAGNIFITSGATHAISLALDVLAAKGKPFVVEDPCHNGITNALALRERSMVRVGVDARGMMVESIPRRKISGIYVTPSHQFPLGHVMSAARRTRLVTLARERNACIIEDDYDSEYRYSGSSLAPLYSLDPDHVIYIGTMSKTLFPALRIGYAIVPEQLHHAWATMRQYTDVQNPITDQAVLAEFLESKAMDLHIKKMTKIYAAKRSAVIEAIRKTFSDKASIIGDSAGLHMAVRFAGKRFDAEFIETCRAHNIRLSWCGSYAAVPETYADTLLLGYGMIDMDNIRPGIAALRALVES